MINKGSFINTVGEYAFDCMNRNDMLLREDVCRNAIEITTQYGNIIVSEDTFVATGRGLWQSADELYIGDTLKHYTMGKAVITGITYIKDPINMVKIVDCACGYLVIDGVYVSTD